MPLECARRAAFVLVLGLAAMGCSADAPVSAPKVAVSTVPTAPVIAAPERPALVGDVAVREVEAPQMSLVTEGWGVALADTVGDVLLFDSLRIGMVAVHEGAVATIENGYKGIEGRRYFVVHHVAGRWPDGALLFGDSNDYEGFFRKKGKWQTLPSFDGESMESPVLTLSNGQVVLGYGTISDFVVLSGDGSKAPLWSAPSEVIPASSTVVSPTGGGLAFVDATMGQESLHLWRPGGAISATYPLPNEPPISDTGRRSHGACAGRDGEVHVVRVRDDGTSALLTLRSGTWSVRALPGKLLPAPNCEVDSAGTLWLMATADLAYRVTTDGAVEAFRFPPLPALSHVQRSVVDDSPERGKLVVDAIPPAAQSPDRFVPQLFRIGADGAVWVEGYRQRGDTPMQINVGGTMILRQAIYRFGPPLPGTPVNWDSLSPPGLLEKRVQLK